MPVVGPVGEPFGDHDPNEKSKEMQLKLERL